MKFGFVCIVTDVIGFFLLAPILTNYIADFTIKKRFAILMVEKGVISESDFHTVQKRQVKIGTGFMLFVLAVCISMIVTIKFNAVIRLIGFGGLGVFFYRKALQYNRRTLQTFCNSYKGLYNYDKLKEFAKEEFGIDI